MKLDVFQLANYKTCRKALHLCIRRSYLDKEQVTAIRENLILFIIEETNEELAKHITAIKP